MLVAQLNRVSLSEGEGRGFESRQAQIKIFNIVANFIFSSFSISMQVHNITKSFNTYFKQNNEPHIFGFDDEISRSKRDYIREWHYKEYMPYQSIYEKEGRMSENQLKSLISDLVQKPLKVNKKIYDIGLINLRSVDKGIYRGAMLDYDNLYNVKKLYKGR